MDQIKIGKFIAELRKGRGMTQEQMAESLGVSSKSVSRWENGRNLPDASLFEPLCDLLQISLTELLCGERVERQDIAQRAEQSLVLNVNETVQIKKRLNKRLIAVISVFAVLIAGLLMAVNLLMFTPSAYHEGDVSQWQGLFPAHSAYKLALNADNKPVFKDPERALKQAKTDYSDAIGIIKKEHHLLPLSKYYYSAYGSYGWQIVTDDEMIRQQGQKLSAFIDIYENSYN